MVMVMMVIMIVTATVAVIVMVVMLMIVVMAAAIAVIVMIMMVMMLMHMLSCLFHQLLSHIVFLLDHLKKLCAGQLAAWSGHDGCLCIVLAKHLNRALYLQVKEVLDVNKAQRHIRGGIATRKKYRGA